MLLHALTTYLRSALPRMRNAFSTLRSETELARAYLDVLRLRMGHRLAVEINVPPALVSAEMPPMILATLVENAIKHGLAPRPSGGRVRIVARQHGDQLKVSVGDDGVGFQRSSGSGVGLANIRSRLASLYGPRGQLRLAANREGGVTATLSLPSTAVTTTAVSS